MVNPFIIDRAKGFYGFALMNDGSIKQREAAAMSFAFACELALKGFMEHPTRGHDLVRLYEKLPVSRRIWLAVAYAASAGRILPDDLAKCRNLFVDFRYYHERAGFVAAIGLIELVIEFLVKAGERAITERPDSQFIGSEAQFPGGLRLSGPSDAE